MPDGSDTPKQAKLTAKQEAFVQAYLETGNASEAYRRSYKATGMNQNAVAKEACLLLKHPNISPRVEATKAAAAERAEISLADIAQMLVEDRQLAHKGEDAKAATDATMSLAKLLGHYVEKKDVKQTTDNRHHHSQAPVSPFIEHLGHVLRDGAEDKTERSLPN